MQHTPDGNSVDSASGGQTRAPLADASAEPVDDRDDDADEHLPSVRHRGARIVELLARVAGSPAALIDLGEAAGPVVFAHEIGWAEQLADAWQAPQQGGPLTLHATQAGTPLAHAFALPFALSGREGWIATVVPASEAAPEVPSDLLQLVEELGEGWGAVRAATQLWVERLRCENSLAAKLIDVSGVGTLVCELSTGELQASARARDILRREAVANMDELLKLVAPHDRIALHRALTGKDGFGRITLECEVVPENGRPMAVRLRIQHILHQGMPTSWLATLEDVTDHWRRLKEMQSLAERDPLTGLHNRNRLIRSLGAAVAEARASREMTAMLMIAVADLKQINDIHGYSTGDLLLKYIAVTLRQQVRATDEVMRIGSGEFAVLLTRATSEEGLLGRVQSIRAALASSIVVGVHRIDLRASIGFAIFPDDTVGGIDLIAATTYALNEALQDGPRAMSRYRPAIRERRERERRLIEEITRALRRDEFTTFFQPKVDLETGSIVGFEALCRWIHPARGVLTPGSFHQALTSPVVSAELSDVGLVSAFKAAKLWREKGLDFGSISVNLSATQLARPNLVEIVEELMRRFGGAVSEISFEVLENVLIGDNNTTHDNLRALSSAGFTISLDDFGTGFASLTHIREPYISEVKIDRSFVTHAGNNVRDQQIVAAVVQMARKLGLKMVAEGIEDEQTLRKLRAVGCTVGQGFVFAPALPFAEATEFIARQHRILQILSAT